MMRWVIDAVIDQEGEFRLRRTYTTVEIAHEVRSRRVEGMLTVHVLDSDDSVIAKASLTKDAGTDPEPGSRRRRIRGAVDLPEDAATARFLDDDREIARVKIAPTPDISIEIDPLNSRRATARISHSVGGEGAWMAVSVFVEGRPPQSAYLGEPREEVELDFSLLYAQQAHVGVLFSNGTTSAAAMSEAVELESGPASLVIVEPEDGTTISRWDVIDARAGLVGGYADADKLADEMEWTLNGEPIGQGDLIALGPLDPGNYRLRAAVPAVRYSKMANVEVTLHVAE